MNRNLRTALALVFGVSGFAACDGRGDDAVDTAPAAEALEEQPATGAPGEPLASGDFAAAEGTTAEVGGRFELRPGAAGDATLTVQLEGLTAGEHAWHIHAGGCATEGPVAIALTPSAGAQAVAGAQALTAGPDGRTTATVTIPEAELGKLHAGTAGELPPPPTQITPPNSENAPVDRPVSVNTLSAEPEFSIHVHERGGADHGPTVACATLDPSRIQERATAHNRITERPPAAARPRFQGGTGGVNAPEDSVAAQLLPHR